MKITLPVKVNKKNSFLIVSALLTLLVFFYQERDLFLRPLPVLFLILFIIFSTYVTNSENMNLKKLVISSLVPLCLAFGLVLSFVFFPNFGVLIRVILSLGFGALFYIILLMNNIFLVVESRGEIIPLYRVAATWAQILLIMVAILMFAGIYKLPLNFFGQTALISGISIVFAMYLLWMLGFDEENKKTKAGETMTLALLNGFLVGLSNIMVSFVPTEAFLRAIFSANVLLFSTTLVYEHLKNNVDKRFLFRSLGIALIFFLIILAFQP